MTDAIIPLGAFSAKTFSKESLSYLSYLPGFEVTHSNPRFHKRRLTRKEMILRRARQPHRRVKTDGLTNRREDCYKNVE